LIKVGQQTQLGRDFVEFFDPSGPLDREKYQSLAEKMTYASSRLDYGVVSCDWDSKQFEEIREEQREVVGENVPCVHVKVVQLNGCGGQNLTFNESLKTNAVWGDASNFMQDPLRTSTDVYVIVWVNKCRNGVTSNAVEMMVAEKIENENKSLDADRQICYDCAFCLKKKFGMIYLGGNDAVLSEVSGDYMLKSDDVTLWFEYPGFRHMRDQSCLGPNSSIFGRWQSVKGMLRYFIAECVVFEKKCGGNQNLCGF
jgi:hypothetical protein